MAAGGGLPAIPLEDASRSGSDASHSASPVTDLVSPYVINHPPLYYALSGLATSWVDVEPLTSAIWYNPHFDYGVRGLRGNKNAVIHTQEEAFPYRGIALAVHISRWVSLLLGSCAVMATYLLSRELFPQRPELALGAAALTAFTPQFLFISARVGNDAAVAGFCSLTLWAAVRFLRREQPGWQPVWLGGFLGLALLSKVSAVGMLPVVALVILLKAIRRRSLPSFVVWTAVTFGVAMAIAGWWYVRNGLLYGDPLLWNVHLELVPRREPTPSLAQLYHREFGSLEISFWAVFGWMNITIHQWMYTGLRLLTRLAALGLLLSVARKAGRWLAAHTSGQGGSEPVGPEGLGLGLAITVLWLVILFLSLLQFMRVQPGGQGRYLFPGISGISLLLLLGLSQWMPVARGGRRLSSILAGSVAGGLFGLSLVCPFIYIAPAYTHPPILSLDQVPDDLQRLQVNFGGQIELLAAAVDRGALRPGQKAEITLCWESLAKADRDYSVFLQLFGREDERVGQLDIYPGVGSYPTSLWQVGDIICDDYEVPTSPQVEGPVAARAEVGLYDRDTMRRLPASDSTRQPVGQVAVGRVKIVPHPWPSYEISRPMHVTVGDRFLLKGYDLSSTEAKPGEQLHVTLYWQATAQGDQDYTVFVHLLDREGHMWDQADAQPLGGHYPTSYWEQGELIQDEYTLTLPPQAPPGIYEVEAGMYLLATGQRLPVQDIEGSRIPEDRIILGPVKLVTP
jgi:hypothetical protein